jgi:hypothetical protein
MSDLLHRSCLLTLFVALTTPLLAQQTDQTLPGYLGPHFNPATQPSPAVTPFTPAPSVNEPAELVRHWNSMALDATGLDHTPVLPGETRVFGEQLGPTRASRAMAIIHIAMFEAVNSVLGGYESYTDIPPAKRGASVSAAIMQAAHDSMAAMYPSQKPTFDTALASELNQIPTSHAKTDGIAAGARAAAAILAMRKNDGSQKAEPTLGVDFFTSDAPGKWRRDPIGQSPIALGAYWGSVRPFFLKSGKQFRAPPPPSLTSPEYAGAYNEAKLIGGDGVTTPTIRTADQMDIGTYWAYDGTPTLCAPPRLYNQITMHIADQMHTSSDVRALARLLALVNGSLADTAIVCWESKFFYQFWRPVTGIRESDKGTGPTGAGDGNPATIGDTTFTPLGAPASNLMGPNFTPPFPSYPSGHGAFGGALFQTLRNFYGKDKVPFTFTSDEFNGVTRDHGGNVRPLLPRSFSSFSQAEDENGQSRIYLGIHWNFDKTQAIPQGESVANFVFAHAFQPRH